MAVLGPGMLFPSLELRDARGQPARPPQRETLCAFFKTTCPTSELTWPYLERIRQMATGGPVAIVAISQDDPDVTSTFNQRLGVHLDTLYDPPPWKASRALGLTNVPTIFLVGSDGKIRETLVGFLKGKMEEFARHAAALAGHPEGTLFGPSDQVPEIKPG